MSELGKKLSSGVSRTNVFLCILIFTSITGKSHDVSLKIHLRGIYESKVSLFSINESNVLKSIITKDSLRAGEDAFLFIPENYHPGEFIIRFDYKEIYSSTPYPSERRIIIGSQNLDLWVNPPYCNNPDSTWFQEGETENTVYSEFLNTVSKAKEKIGLLQNFLLNYDDNGSDFYKTAIIEYEKRRDQLNDQISEEKRKHRLLFASTLFAFQYIPEISWQGDERMRVKSLRDNYFSLIDFGDSLLVRTARLKEWMDGYVNLYGELAATIELRDSLFTLAGRTAMEKAKTGHPLVYGWMADYFFNGFESFNITKGIEMLEPYLEDPRCLTSKRQEINRRLAGIKNLHPGTPAPQIIMPDKDGTVFNLYSRESDKKYTLLLFWSADCSHCSETIESIYPLSQQVEYRNLLEVIAISLDETETEVKAWNAKTPPLSGWLHLRLEEGVRSKVASDYFILSTPVMILLDSRTKIISALPENAAQLKKLLRE